MEEDGQPEAIAQFCSITGCSAHVAEHYLSACNYDLDRSIEFFFENPPDAASVSQIAEDEQLAQLQQQQGQRAAASSGPAAARAPHASPAAEDVIDLSGEDEELQRALAESLGAGADCSRAILTVKRPASTSTSSSSTTTTDSK